MISIAITGGIGSGKSFVSHMLEERGIPIYNTDDEALAMEKLVNEYNPLEFAKNWSIKDG